MMYKLSAICIKDLSILIYERVMHGILKVLKINSIGNTVFSTMNMSVAINMKQTVLISVQCTSSP